jgi:N-acyl-D-amino-acid deacylase
VLGKFARQEKLFSMEEAIRKMTYLPASILAIPKRGLLQPGFFADITIFDPDNVKDQATWENPKQYPKGIPYVMVNGKFVFFENEHTTQLPGKILTKHFNPVTQIKKKLKSS